jgi:hypothetical protein
MWGFIMKHRDQEELSFRAEIDNDISKTALMLSREGYTASTQEKHSIEIFKRVLTVVDCGGLGVTDGESIVSASNNQLPVSSYLAHGSRILIQIPPVANIRERHEFINWLIHGDRNHNFTDRCGSEHSALFKRSISSHSTHLTSSEGKWVCVEDKGVFAGTVDTLGAFGKSAEQAHHFGLNFAFGVDKLGEDRDGNFLQGPDGEHGHMYLHYRAPSADYPGSLMIGVENSEPGKSNHSLLGTPNKFTHIGGTKWSELREKYRRSSEEMLIMPATLNGMRIDLSHEKQEDILSGRERFDSACIIRAPKQRADLQIQRLVNKKLDRAKRTEVTLAELFIEHQSNDPVILEPPMSKKRLSVAVKSGAMEL